MIYHILIDRFNGGWDEPPHNELRFLGGTLRGITQKLDYIKQLGANAIMLTPFFKMVAYHGYHIVDYEEIEPRFGTMDDLQELISIAHAKDMRVISDFVPNHCHISHPFFQDAINNMESSPYWNWFFINRKDRSDYKCFCDYKELAKFNLENAEVSDYFVKIGLKLLDAGIDGFRIDHALGVPMSFLSCFCRQMHAANPKCFVLGEVWGYNVSRRFYKLLYFRSVFHKLYYLISGLRQESIQTDYIGVLDGVLDFKFRDLLLDEIKAGRRLKDNKHLNKMLKRHFSRYDSSFKAFPFLDNHDTDRFMFDCRGDSTLLDEAVDVMRETGFEYIVYYGTECGMQNEKTIFNAEPYADLRVREPMNWKIL